LALNRFQDAFDLTPQLCHFPCLILGVFSVFVFT
jgi:hypothetical protein